MATLDDPQGWIKTVASWSDLKLRNEGVRLRRLIEHGDPIAEAMLPAVDAETQGRRQP